MKDIEMPSDQVRTLRALVEVESMSHDARRYMAYSSSDHAVLAVLSRCDIISDDCHMARGLLGNKDTPAEALTNLMRNQDLIDKYGLSYEDGSLLSRLAVHRNANLGTLHALTNCPEWEVRYALTRRDQVPDDILRALSCDSNLAVAASASKRLRRPEVDEGLGLGVKCSEMNAFFDKVRNRLRSHELEAEKLADRLQQDPESGNPLGYFFGKCEQELKGLRDSMCRMYVGRLQKDCVPNINLGAYNFPRMMNFCGNAFFDAYMIAATVKHLMKRRASLSLHEMHSGAKCLVQSGSSKHILRGRHLELRAYSSKRLKSVSRDREAIDMILALDMLSKVVLRGADPATVTSGLAKPLFVAYCSGTFQRLPAGDPTVSVRIYKNGRVDADYATEAEAKKMAEFLLADPEPVEAEPSPC